MSNIFCMKNRSTLSVSSLSSCVDEETLYGKFLCNNDPVYYRNSVSIVDLTCDFIKGEKTETLNGEHHWYSCTHSRPTICNVCRDSLPGVTAKGLSCEVCRFKAHKKCASKAPPNCKWTTIECIPIEHRLPNTRQNEYSMPHQWLEGNILPGQHCVICSKPCGNRRKLQDWTCLWCNNCVHSSCKSQCNEKCSLGLNGLSIIPPTVIKRANHLGVGYWETLHPAHRSPLLVFVNSKSGDNQGVGFMRRFKQLLNPAQVFDLSVAGPKQGVAMGKHFESFRILVCGGDGSVGWVMTELDKQNLTNKCQIGVLPLGTGNDLARVFRWGSACYDVNIIPIVLQQLEQARHVMLDRWAIMIKEFPSGRPEEENILSYEDSVAMHITRMLASNQHDIVIQSARFLCQAIKDFVELVGDATLSKEYGETDQLSIKCKTLQHKLELLLRTLQIESEASFLFRSVKVKRRSSASETVELELSPDHIHRPASRWHSDSEIDNEDMCAKDLALQYGKQKQKVFVPKEHLWSRANSLKKAMKEIIDHTEKAVDEQNHQTVKAIASKSGLSQVLEDVPQTIVDAHDKDESTEKTVKTADTSIRIDRPLEGTKFASLLQKSSSELDLMVHKSINQTDTFRQRLQTEPTKGEGKENDIVKTRTFNSISSINTTPLFTLNPELLLSNKLKTSNTIMYPKTIIARAFQKQPKITDKGVIGKVLLANASAFCATALPTYEQEEKLMNFKEKCVMNNYFGVGIDAKISLDFHTKREEHPEKCRSRTRNFIWYGVLGGRELIQRTHRNLEQNVHLEVDGRKIDLPSLQGIVILNIQSYMGGSNFWGTKKEMDGFRAPSFDDKMLEVVAVLGATQMGISKVFGGMQHHRIAQCHMVKITITDEAVPVQVDGEAWMQSPGIIQIMHKNRASMLMRDRDFEETLRSWNALKQCKSTSSNKSLNEHEMSQLQPLVVAVMSLVRSVKAASMMNDVVQQELFQSASSLATLMERFQFMSSPLSPQANQRQQQSLPSNDVITHHDVEEFIHAARSFTSEVNEKMWTLRPKFSTELEARIASSLSSTDQQISVYCDKQKSIVEPCEKSSRDEPRKNTTQATSKSWNLFSRKTSSPKIGKSDNEKAVLDWGVNDVGVWLDTIGCSEYKNAFMQHDITGPELIAIEKHDLTELGVTKVGHSKRILEKANQLRKSIDASGKRTRKTAS